MGSHSNLHIWRFICWLWNKKKGSSNWKYANNYELFYSCIFQPVGVETAGVIICSEIKVIEDFGLASIASANRDASRCSTQILLARSGASSIIIKYTPIN